MQEAEAAAARARKSERRSEIYRPGQPQRCLRDVSIRQNQRRYPGRLPRHRPPRQSAGPRELVIDRYPLIIPYRVVGNELQVLRVFHTRRKPPKVW